jgi:nitroreductase
MDVFEAIHRRRAVRQYSPAPVKKEDIHTILDAANWAPSGMNRQPWEFVVVTGKKIGEIGASYRKVSEEYTKNWNLSPMRGSLTREEFIQFAGTYGGAPVVIVVLTNTNESSDLRKANLESASASMENLLLAATALGLGTCWMTGPLRDEKVLRNLLAIPEDKEIVAITPLGYPQGIPKDQPRLDPELKRKVRWVE